MPKNNFGRTAPVSISQNFLTSAKTINRIISIAKLGKNDHIVEIGAGRGHITRALLSRCGPVTAVEIDKKLFDGLSAKYGGHAGLHLVCGNFLKYTLPQTPYKVFANIPFSHTSDIIRKLTRAPNPPVDAWLVLEKGAAKRFCGLPRESLASLTLKPFFDAEIRYHFRRDDFHPAPSVDTVLLHLNKKHADIDPRTLSLYSRFISACIADPRALFRFMTKRQAVTALKAAGLSCDITPRDMLYVQWLCLFRCYLKYSGHS